MSNKVADTTGKAAFLIFVLGGGLFAAFISPEPWHTICLFVSGFAVGALLTSEFPEKKVQV